MIHDGAALCFENRRKSVQYCDLEEIIMKTWRLVSGILSIVFSMLILFQSCAVGLGNTLTENGEVGGSGGVFVAVMLLSGGIVSIATRGGGKGGAIALAVLCGLGALVGFATAGSYSDLRIWSVWCLICAALAVVFAKKASETE